MRRLILILTIVTLAAISVPARAEITGVTVSGSTVHAGTSNQVTLDSNGITIVAADNAPNRYKFDNGSFLGGKVGSADILVLSSVGDVWQEIGNGGLLVFDSGKFGPAVGNSNSYVDLGSPSAPWKTLYADGVFVGDLGTGAVCASGGNLVMCSENDVIPAAARQRIAELEARIEALEAALAARER